MDKLKQYIVFTVLGCLVVMAAGWMFVVSPKRSEAADLRLQADEARASNAQLKTRVTVLRGQAKDLPKEQAKLADVAAKIPGNPALPGLIRALTKASVSTGVELVSVTPGVPVAAVTAAAPSAPAAGAPAAPVASPAPGGAAPAAAGALASIPLTLNVAGAYFDIQRFLVELERLPRSFRTTQLTMSPGSNPLRPVAGSTDDGRALISTITGQVFMALNRPSAIVAPSVPAIAPKK